MNVEVPKYLARSAAWHAELVKLATAIGMGADPGLQRIP
jgi:hypothetical protein